jgi:hypothetical protein
MIAEESILRLIDGTEASLAYLKKNAIALLEQVSAFDCRFMRQWDSNF